MEEFQETVAPEEGVNEGQELVDELKALMQKYVSLPSDEHTTVVALWVLHTWFFEVANVTPYLFIYSSEPGSGKTRLLEVLSILAQNAKRAEDMTAPIMFKIIEREKAALLIDEVDTIWSGSRNEEKRRILNTGYKRGGLAWREQARELIPFSTFSPKVLAGLKNGFLPRTIYDRSIPIPMKRRGRGDRLERFIEHQVAASKEVDDLLGRILAFKEKVVVDVALQRPDFLALLGDRQNEISEPLLAIASVCGMEDHARGCLEKVFGVNTGVSNMSPQQVLLDRIRTLFGEEESKLFTETLCVGLGPSYNGRQLALILEPFGIQPKDLRIGNRVSRGYTRDQFEEVWDMYLEPVRPNLELVEGGNEPDETVDGGNEPDGASQSMSQSVS